MNMLPQAEKRSLGYGMKTKLGIVGCGFLGNIVADAWKKGLLPDYELVGVTSRTRASAEKTAANVAARLRGYGRAAGT